MAIRPLPLIVAITVLLISGIAHGVWTQRWRPARELEEACTRLASVPHGAGSWSSSDIATDPEAFQQARAVAYWMRRYSKEGGGGPITVILMCGRPGHMAVHTPDICYRGAGHDIIGEPVKESIALGNLKKPASAGRGDSQYSTTNSRFPQAEFWTARFRQSPGSISGDLRIHWAWSANGNWQAPASPRWTFGGEPFLYKLYVVRDGDASDASTTEFIRALMPVLEKSLFGG